VNFIFAIILKNKKSLLIPCVQQMIFDTKYKRLGYQQCHRGVNLEKCCRHCNYPIYNL